MKFKNFMRLNITAKIWLSIGIFLLGYVLSTALVQLQGLKTESALQVTADALFPAAQLAQEAEAGYQSMVKGLSDAVVMQDSSALERSLDEGRKVAGQLKSVGKIQGLSDGQSTEALRVAELLDEFVSKAGEVYGAVLSNPTNMSADVQNQMRDMAGRMETLKGALEKEKTSFSKDLRDRLAAVRVQSANQRTFALVLFGATLVVAGLIVNLTIRRAITRPIMGVIHGVQSAADEAANAAGEMKESGEVVARDAQEQAACLEETSASLEQISAATRENAGRATQADSLMGDAKHTVERATEAMRNLTLSMDAIASSSREVASVLKSIDEIAFYTNILALNAAVEAARAGDAGVGFSVVADEVRSLAHRAAEAAGTSAGIVEKTIKDVTKGVEFVSVARGAFEAVSSSIGGSSQVVSEIARSSEEQALGIAQIGKAVAKMEAVTQSNTANATRTADSASAMTEQMEKTRSHLRELVGMIGFERG